MKPEIPAANAIIATIYLLIIMALCYAMKLVFRPKVAPRGKQPKYTQSNITKGINNPTIWSHLSVNRVLASSYALKYCAVGTFFNGNKCYLLKEILTLSVIFVACTSINKITFWPVALSVLIVALSFVAMEVFRLPFLWNLNTKIQQQKKAKNNSSGSQHLELEPGLIVNQHGLRDQEPVKEAKYVSEYSYKYIGCLGAIGFASLVMITQTMMTVYNSISNLGALNLGSVACIIAIDQLAVRPTVGVVLIATANIVMLRQRANLVNSQSAAQGAKNGLAFFQIQLFRNLCGDSLLQKMNEIYDQYGEPSNYDMGASPTRKKTFSPSKIPKAVVESETLMNLDLTKRQQAQQQKVQQVERSPIKQIEMAVMKQSVWLTTIEKQMFCQEVQNNQLEVNKSVQIQSAQKIKVNPNQYFSVQRLPKDEVHHEQMEDDGLVLVEAGLNLVKQREGKMKPNTIDIEFSPTKKRKKTVGAYPKRRQLIITGSSPYLEYLPDMMKKEKQNKKNMTPSSQNHIPTVSRKVL